MIGIYSYTLHYTYIPYTCKMYMIQFSLYFVKHKLLTAYVHVYRAASENRQVPKTLQQIFRVLGEIVFSPNSIHVVG